MNTLIVVLLLVAFGAVIGLLVIVNKKLSEIAKPQDKDSLMLIAKSLDTMHQRLDKSAEVIGKMFGEFGEVKELGRSMKDFANFFRSPKLRGGIGEQVLYDFLGQILPKENLKTQYKFKDGQIVDAAIITRQGIIPIDSKFPLEDFKRLAESNTEEEHLEFSKDFIRAVKKHIDDIAKKYILPDEETVDFAAMYVPSEGVYHEILVHHDEIFSHAQSKNIILISPSTLYAFLQIILRALQEEYVEQKSKTILKMLVGLKQDFGKFGESLDLVNTHMTNAKNAMEKAHSEFEKIETKMEKTELLR